MDLSLIPIVIVIYVISSIKILAEYERGVVFRLGRVLATPKGPGVVLVFSPIDRMVRMSLRVEAMEVPAQDVVTRDNVTVKVNAVIYFRIVEPTKAVIEVANYLYATSQLAQTTLRSVLGETELDELLSQREKLNIRLQSVLDQHTGPWGMKVTMVEVKQVDLPEQMIRAIARQAEAERERRAKIIHAEGEMLAAVNLEKAAEMMARQPVVHPAPLPSNAGRNRRGEEHDSCVSGPHGYTLVINEAVGQVLEARDINSAQERRRRVRTDSRQPPADERVFHRGDPAGRVLRDGLHRGKERVAGRRAGCSLASYGDSTGGGRLIFVDEETAAPAPRRTQEDVPKEADAQPKETASQQGPAAKPAPRARARSADR